MSRGRGLEDASPREVLAQGGEMDLGAPLRRLGPVLADEQGVPSIY